MKKLILTYGTIAGVVVSAMLLITLSGSSRNFENGELIGYASMIIAFATIFVAVKSYRDKSLDGNIGFKQAFSIGLGITLVATAIYILSWMIMSETIASDFMSEYYQYSIEKLKASDLTETEIDEKIAEMEYFKELYKNPMVKIGMTFLEIFPVGLLVSLISAFILKSRAKV
ncbi:MAG: DUF4199 domain-containing protein [Cyclobacteriaceae bacterium]